MTSSHRDSAQGNNKIISRFWAFFNFFFKIFVSSKLVFFIFFLIFFKKFFQKKIQHFFQNLFQNFFQIFFFKNVFKNFFLLFWSPTFHGKKHHTRMIPKVPKEKRHPLTRGSRTVFRGKNVTHSRGTPNDLLDV